MVLEGNFGGEIEPLVHSLFNSTEDAAVVANINNVLRQFLSLSGAFPSSKFMCAANAIPMSPSSFLFHTLEALGADFIVENKEDVFFLNSVSLPASRQSILNAHCVSSFLENAAANGIYKFPVDTHEQLERVLAVRQPCSEVTLTYHLKDEQSWLSTLNSALSILFNCIAGGLRVTGLAFKADFPINEASLRRMMTIASFLIRKTRDLFGCEISDLYLGPEFLKTGNSQVEWSHVLRSALEQSSIGDQITVHFDVTNFIFVDAFMLWARVKDKQHSSSPESRQYTVSEGVFSLFGNLLGLSSNEEKPCIVACSGFEQESDWSQKRQKSFSSKVVGPTGDAELDLLVDNCHLPDLSPVIDWLMIGFGAVIPSGLAADAQAYRLLYVIR